MMYHDGHRERLRHRYIKSGIDGFQDHEIIELILTYAIPRRDVNPIAHKIADELGGLTGVLESDIKTLSSIEGIGERSAVLIKLFNDVGRRYQLDKCGPKMLLDSVQSMGQYCVALAHGRTQESLHLVCLDAQKRLISVFLASEGTPGEVQVQIRKLIEIALKNNADSVVLTHNHPGGTATPSHNDIMTTHHITDAFKAVGIKLIDHIIVAQQQFMSMNELGYMKFR